MAELYTKALFESDVEWLEQRRSRLRRVFLAGQLPNTNIPEEWRIDGIEYKRLDDEIVMEIERLEKKLKFSGFVISQSKGKTKQVDNGRGLSLKPRWQTVDEQFAINARHAGVPTRFIGRWQVQTR